ncbi:MAG: small subunit ribosomal protein S20 [Planctomycetota bacterium]|jgi:small subunit ribosomal protein S20
MPNSKQSKKRVVQNDKRRIANKSVRQSMRTAVKKVLTAETPDEAKSHLDEAFRRVDKAAKKNIIHENAAARKKSQLVRAASGN